MKDTRFFKVVLFINAFVPLEVGFTLLFGFGLIVAAGSRRQMGRQQLDY